MHFAKSVCIRVLVLVPVCLVYLITTLNLMVFHQGVLPERVESVELLLSTLIVYFCLFTGIWAYTKSFITEPGHVPLEFDLLPDDAMEKLSDDEFGEEKTQVTVSYCEKCQRSRPARAHHCVFCNKCVMRMDHHCPWMGNCIGICNYRTFVQTIFYALVTTAIISGCCAEIMIQRPEIENLWTVVGCLFTMGLFVMLAVLFVYHFWMICVNTNTIELVFYHDRTMFDFGWLLNVQEVLGNTWLGYVFPINIPIKQGFGYVFPVKIKNKAGETVFFHDKVLV
jgi:hypothetical protein